YDGFRISQSSHRQTKNNVSEMQKLFQKDNGIPELFIGGLPYKATMALQNRGVRIVGRYGWILSFPRSTEIAPKNLKTQLL
uniref:Uncharacterized protein n=1 Tax=Dromaius novaehollandiae TaxID=8790 RepID=A0A8C4KKZ5_DRONO